MKIKWFGRLLAWAAAQASKTSYNFVCTNPSLNSVYYRIKAVENTGNDYLSSEAVIKSLDDNKMIRISPNPADEYIAVYSGEDNIPDGRRIYITDVSGKKYLISPIQKNIWRLIRVSLPMDITL